jgi:UDP-2,3-diacylglucosamine pyrophosphatase LpxH
MLVVFSDLHITDGTAAVNPHPTAFQALGVELAASAKAKSAKELEVVMLGDIFDVVRSDYWHRHVPAADRPWGGRTLDPGTGMNAEVDAAPQFDAVLDAVLRQESAGALIGMVRNLGERTGLAPRVTYVVGNHDRVLNNFPSLRRRIETAFAPVRVVFGHEYASDDYAILARHGHEWDENCHGWKFLTRVLQKRSRAGRFDEAVYRVMAIGEVVTAELMSGLIYHARQALPAPADRPFLDHLVNINNLRPMTDVFRWLTWTAADRYTAACGDALRLALDGVLGNTLARRWDALKPDLLVSGDLTDYLSKARAVLEYGGVGGLRELVPLYDDVEAALNFVARRKDALFEGAAREAQALPDDSATQYILYGHTHFARHDCFAGRPDGRVRMYVNTGTFLPLIQRSMDRGFFDSNRMTYVCFYREDEDTQGRADAGPTMDVWDGIKRKQYVAEGGTEKVGDTGEKVGDAGNVRKAAATKTASRRRRR